MEDRRLNDRLLQYWNMIRKDRTFPQIENLNPEIIGDVWPRCFLVSVDTHSSESKYRYEYMGENITAMYGRDLTGTIISSEISKHFPGSVAIKKMDEVVADYKPMESEGHFVNQGGKLIKYRACFLPFGKPEELTHIIAGLSYRIF